MTWRTFCQEVFILNVVLFAHGHESATLTSGLSRTASPRSERADHAAGAASRWPVEDYIKGCSSVCCTCILVHPWLYCQARCFSSYRIFRVLVSVSLSCLSLFAELSNPLPVSWVSLWDCVYASSACSWMKGFPFRVCVHCARACLHAPAHTCTRFLTT